MAQYVTYNPDTYVEYTDGVSTFRQGSRDDNFVTDKTITANGFDGTENVDWENIEEVVYSGTTGVWRDGVRGGMFIIDTELTSTGFAGTVNIDWCNVDSLPL
jgi:hypothetical protein